MSMLHSVLVFFGIIGLGLVVALALRVLGKVFGVEPEVGKDCRENFNYFRGDSSSGSSGG